MRNIWHLLGWLPFFTCLVHGVSIDFSSCVSNSVVRSGTYFESTYVDALYDDNLNQVNLTITGNMHGSVPDLSTDTNRLTTLRTSASILQFQLSNTYERFCSYVENGSCPFGPNNDIGFLTSYPLANSYYFVSISTLVAVIDPTAAANVVACIRTSITPTFAPSVYAVLTFVPLGVLVLVGFSVVLAAIYNPWTGTKDFFSWSSNYGQDPDTLRLVTPGFSDVLQYLQFAYLIGSLNLAFPGFYQPTLSSVSWASLQFNVSSVSHMSRNHRLHNIYSVDGEWGISNQSQLIGQGEDRDVWTCFVVWLLVVVAAVVAIAQFCFLTKWIWYKVTSRHSVDLRSKNLPVTGGMIIRVFFNYFSLPLVAYSSFQLLISPHTAIYISVLAGVLLLIWIVSAVLAVRTIRLTKPQQALYDDLPTLLLLGPLYNTYTERGFMFCAVQLLCTCLRGIVIGAVQPSGTAQITLLAITELVFFLSLNIFRPFHPTTSMNIYHVILSVIRLLTTLFSVAFIPTLRVNDTAKGWVAYAILVLHALVIIVVFFLHALQAVIETFARLAGVTGETSNTFARAFGLRQLARRRRPKEKLGPMEISGDVTLADVEIPSTGNLEKSPLDYSLHPSLSANLLDPSAGSISAGGKQSSPISPTSAFAYYRMPRRTRAVGSWAATRSATDESSQSANKLTSELRQAPSISSSASGVPQVAADPFRGEDDSSVIGTAKNDGDSDIWNPASLADTPRNVDYAVRESDVYFHTRTATTLSGPSSLPSSTSAFSSQERGPRREPLSFAPRYSRKLGTGPADPTGVSAGVRGWFSRQMDTAADKLHIGRRNKGFVVVRNAPMRSVVYDEEFGHRVSTLAEERDEEGLAEIAEKVMSSRQNPNRNIMVDQTVPKNTYTPIIRSPVPPALRRQQQRQQQPPQLSPSRQAFAPDDVESSSEESDSADIMTSSATALFSPMGEQQGSQVMIQHNDRDESGASLDTSAVGAVRSMRVGDAIRSSQYGTEGFESGKLIADED
ncbi:hypothetical protein V1520DRAFT_367378 [Lipomyces starkeyi]|uniref:ML-like domain-containing protein n=1 Tax=Lipomyces starkeyi NRRL Y-11557 TaxID=675824 RepID=A0A1E3QF86_LIPST|nr:hypothetical protein LIPSTDRAFT_212801 [Lipomyces starkeyi NRRL Y-11557]